VNQTAGRFEYQACLGFTHRQDAGLEYYGRHANRIRSRHRRRIFGFHDDECCIRLGMLWRYEEIYVPKNASTRLVQHDTSQAIVFRDPARLLPDGVARWRRNAVNDDVADFTFGMTPDDVYDAVFVHAHSVIEA
jgi:hypothetical protein